MSCYLTTLDWFPRSCVFSTPWSTHKTSTSYNFNCQMSYYLTTTYLTFGPKELCVSILKVSTVIPRKLAFPNSRNSLTRGSDCCSLTPNSRHLSLYKFAPKFAILGHFLSPKNREFGGITVHHLTGL